MDGILQSDEHTSAVDALVTARDWAGLCRYWIAHQHEPASRLAMQIVRSHPSDQSLDWPQVVAFVVGVMTNPYDLNRQCNFKVPASCTELDSVTLSLLEMYPVAILCEGAAFAPLHLRPQLFQSGLQAAQASLEASHRIGDRALRVFFLMLMARARTSTGEQTVAGDLYQRALEILRPLSHQQPEIFQIGLARALNGLGMVRRDLNNLGAALSLLNEAAEILQALTDRTPGRFAPDVAAVLDNLGIVQYSLNRFEDASRSLTKALRMRKEHPHLTNEAYRPSLAASLNNLAVVEIHLGNWEAAHENLDGALEIRRKLAEKHRGVFLPAVAETLNNLGNLQRKEGRLEDSSRSLEESLAIRRKAADTQPETFLSLVADSLGNLGNTQRSLNLPEEAVACYLKASDIYRELAKRPPHVFQPDLAGTLRNLGDAELELGLLEPGLAHCEQSTEIYDHLAKHKPECFLPSLAASLNDLGNVQRNLNRLRAAITSYEKSLDVYRSLERREPDIYRGSLATCLANLGTAQSDLREFCSACASLAEAITLFRKLAEKRPSAFLAYLMTTLNSLGNAQREANVTDAALDTLGEAAAICEELMRERPEIHRPDLARILNNVGTVLKARHSLGDALASLRKAAALYASEAEAHPFTLLEERLRCWVNIGSLHRLKCQQSGCQDCLEARQAFREACACAELLRGRYRSPQQRRRIQTEVAAVYETLVQSCVDVYLLNQDCSALTEAVEVAEAARSRQLLDLLEDEGLEPAAPPALAKRFQEIRRRLRLIQRLSAEQDAPPITEAARDVEEEPTPRSASGSREFLMDPSSRRSARESRAHRRRLRDEAITLAAQYRVALGEIQTRYAEDFDPDQPIPPIKYEAIQALLPTDKPTAIVQYSLGVDQGVAFIITRDQILAVPLPELGDTQARRAAATWFQSYYTDTQEQITALSRAASHASAAGADDAADRLRKEAADLQARWATQWEAALPGLLETISEWAIRPVVDRLSALSVQRLILSPSRSLHLYPLHACCIGESLYLADRYEIVYTPSLSLLHRCAHRQRHRQERVLLVANPTGDLLFADMEGEKIRQRHPGCVVLDAAEATGKRFAEEAKASTLLHYSGHCSFNPSDPLSSALVLGNHDIPENRFSLREVFCRLLLPENRLTVLNGCESGMLVPDVTDDYVSLPTGFLYAGATCVLASLWSAFDLPAALLMDRFHKQLQMGDSPAAALREAQRWLRVDIKTGKDLVEVILPEFLEDVADLHQRECCLQEAASFVSRSRDAAPFESPAHWASFAAYGLAYPIANHPEPHEQAP